jgi:SET domain-containing protein
LYEVRKSPIHGKGVFALRDIPIHTRIGVYAGKKTDDGGRYVLQITYDDGSELWLDGTNDLKFLNHQKPGNAYFRAGGRGNVLYSRRNIRAGDEITFDYGVDEDWEIS